MMNLERWLASDQVQATILLAGVALALVGAGSMARAIWKTRSLKSRSGFNAVLLAVLGIGLAGFTLANRPQYFQRYLPTVLLSDQENRAELEALKAASLERNTSSALAGDWPQWRGPRRDGVSDETGLRTDWTNAPPTVVWRSPLGGGYSSIAISGGRLYTMNRKGNNERVVCFDASTGTELWVHAYPVDYDGVGYGSGPRACPTVADGRIYTVGATGVMCCLEAAPRQGSPQLLWKHDLMSEFAARMPYWGVACSPLVDGAYVFVQPGGKNGSVVAFDRQSGQVVWQALSDISGYSSPVLATSAGARQIVCFTGAAAVGLRSADGRQLWYYPWATSHDANIATPIVAGDYVFISSAYGTGCALLRMKPGKDEGVDVEAVYVKHNKLMRNHHSTCVLRDGFLYGFDDNVLRCVDLRRGEEKWHGRGIAKGCVVLADGHLIVLSEDGNLSLVDASPSGFKTRGRLSGVLTIDCWALPALAAGRLYLRDHTQLVCVDVRKK